MAAAPPMSAAAAAKRREAQGERTNTPFGAAGPSGAPASPPTGHSSMGATPWQGQEGAGASDERDVASSDDHRRPSVMVHTDGGSLLDSAENEPAAELPPT